MKTVEFKQGSPEWHAWRLSGIGGSDAPCVIGNSPYRTLRQLYFEKRGKVIEEDEDKEFIFAKGHQVEGLIRSQFQDLTGVEMKPICVVHSEFSHVIASLDGYDPSQGVLEAKLVGQAALEAAREGKIPDHHFTQMQHQFAAAGADVGQWFGHDGKKNGVLVEVRADQEYIKNLLDRENVFWEMVKFGQEPPLSDRDYLIPEDQALLKQLREAKEHMDNATSYYDHLKEVAIATYKHTKIAGAGLKIYQVKRQGSVNYKSVPELKSLDANYLDQFRTKESVSWTVKRDNEKESA